MSTPDIWKLKIFICGESVVQHLDIVKLILYNKREESAYFVPKSAFSEVAYGTEV